MQSSQKLSSSWLSLPKHCVLHSRQNYVVIKTNYSHLCHWEIRKRCFRSGHSPRSVITSGSRGFLRRKTHCVHGNNEIKVLSLKLLICGFRFFPPGIITVMVADPGPAQKGISHSQSLRQLRGSAQQCASSHNNTTLMTQNGVFLWPWKTSRQDV